MPHTVGKGESYQYLRPRRGPETAHQFQSPHISHLWYPRQPNYVPGVAGFSHLQMPCEAPASGNPVVSSRNANGVGLDIDSGQSECKPAWTLLTFSVDVPVMSAQ